VLTLNMLIANVPTAVHVPTVKVPTVKVPTVKLSML
jgi:hypothetical protein